MLSLEEIFVNTIENEKQSLNRIRAVDTDEVQSKSDKDMLWYYNERFALGAFFLEHNVQKAKEHFYVCGRIDEYLITKYNERTLDYGVSHFAYAILSDNTGLINRYATFSHPWYAHTIKSGSLTHAMQNIVKEDWESLKSDISIYERITATQKGRINVPDLMFFKGVLNRDEQMVLEAITLLLKDHKKRNRHMGIAQDYISMPALGYAKLAWLKGMEIEIDHPLIPKKLLPYRPLERYEDKYEFLKELND